MHLIIVTLLYAVLVLLILLDVLQKIRLAHPLIAGPAALAAANFPLLLWKLNDLSTRWRYAYLLLLFVAAVYWIGRVSIAPYLDFRSAGLRLNIMRGGRYLCLLALWTMFAEATLLGILYARAGGSYIPLAVCIVNGLYALGFVLLLFLNGGLRMACTSRRLGVLHRVVLLLTMWIPGINLVVLLYHCRLVKEEYQYACEREAQRQVRRESDLCRTQYPLVLVHGVFFRDWRYFNYWGRIPTELMRNGATIYYRQPGGCRHHRKQRAGNPGSGEKHSGRHRL